MAKTIARITALTLALLLLAGCNIQVEVDPAIAKGVADAFVAAIDDIVEGKDTLIDAEALESLIENAKNLGIENAFPELYETMKKTVDAIIEKTFSALKIRSFCNSRIAFCAETRPGVRNVFLCDIDGGDVQQLTAYRSLCVEPAWFPNGKSVHLFFAKSLCAWHPLSRLRSAIYGDGQ